MKTRLIPTAAYALVLLLGGAGSETLSAQTLPRIAPTVVESIASQGRTRVLVELAVADQPRGMSRRSAAQASEHRAKIAVQRQLLLSTLGKGSHRVVHEFANTPYVALDIDAAALAKLEAAPAVAVRVLEDSLLRPSLANSVPRIDADRAHAVGFNGTGTAVAVIDSGVDRTHPFFASRLIEEACFATAEIGSGGDCPNGQATQIGSGAATSCAFAPFACRHGTHVAGIAVGDGVEFSGVAPAASLIAIQVFHASQDCLIFFEEFPCPRAFASDIVAGLEHVYALRNQYNIASVNLSLGGTAYDSACDAESPLFAAAIGNLRSAGIATIAASGNDGLTYGISEPACVSAAISVGATDAYDDVAWFSNSSADLDLLAPGTPITSSVTGGGFDTLEGTSMAAPHVAGAWAIYKQAFPTATVDEALASFIDTGVPITDWLRGGPTKPRIRVGTALGLVAPEPEPLNTTLTPSTNSAAPGDAVTLTVADAPGGEMDWLALANVDSPATSFLAYVYVGAGVTDRTWTVDMPQTSGEYEFRLFANNGFTQLAVSAPITVVEPEPEPEPGPTTLTPSTNSAAPGDAVTLTVADAPGGATDWLALANVDAPATSFLAFVYVGAGVTDRTWTVDMPQTPGEYEFRLFADGGYTQLAVSAPITVVDPEPEPGPTTLTPSTNSAAPGDAVTLTVADAPGGATDWLALANVDAPATTFLTFVYVGAGVTDRTWTVDMPQTPGEYEFRLFADGGYTQLAVSAPITVVDPEPEPGPTALTPSTNSAAPGDAVTLTVADAPGGATDWLALANVDAPATSFLAFVYVGAGVTDRTWTVDMPQTPGEYEFRLFANNGYTQLAVSAPITVVDPEPEPGTTTLTTSTNSAAPGDAVTLTVADAPGGATDWLALANVDAPATSFLAFVYVGAGVTDRTWTVDMPQTPGEYEFRLFANNGYTQLAVSAPITVVDPEPEPGTTTLTTSTNSAAPGDAVTLTVADAPGGATDWLALANVDAPATSFLAFVYVGAGVTDRTWTVDMPQTPGEYEFRLFADGGYTQLAVSAPITVVDPEPEPGPTTLTPSTNSAAPGDAVTLTVADAPGGAADWLALANVDAPATTFLTFVYVGAGVTDRTWTVDMPQTPGEYEFRLFADGGYTQLAVSAPITVVDPEPEPGPTTLTPSTNSAAPGDAVTLTVADAPGGATDWLALANVDAPATTFLTFVYVGAGVTDRTWTVDMPQTPGEYEFRLFLNNGFTELAVSPPVTVE